MEFAFARLAHSTLQSAFSRQSAFKRVRLHCYVKTLRVTNTTQRLLNLTLKITLAVQLPPNYFLCGCVLLKLANVEWNGKAFSANAYQLNLLAHPKCQHATKSAFFKNDGFISFL